MIMIMIILNISIFSIFQHDIAEASIFKHSEVSKDNQFFNAHGYWKGPTWIDQTWFAYAGLRRDLAGRLELGIS